MLDIFGTPPLGPVYLLTIFDLDVLAKPARVTSWKKRISSANCMHHQQAGPIIRREHKHILGVQPSLTSIWSKCVQVCQP
jgi:hypothetical protein